MSLTYLNKKVEVQLDSTASGQLYATVPNSQYWLPTLVCIAVNPLLNVGDNLTFRLEVGSPGSFSASNIIDSTILGTNDSTGVLAGLIIPPGIAINGHWTPNNANSTFDYAGATAIMSIYGLVSDVPPALGIQPVVPGFKFTGSSAINGASVTTDDNSGNSALEVNINNNYQLYPDTIQLIDTGSLAPNAVFPIFGAVPNLQYYLHSMSLSLSTQASSNCNIQQTDGTVLDILIWTFETAVGVVAPLPAREYKGAPLNSVGVGLALKNTSGAAQRFIGYITYSSAFIS